MTVNSKYIFYKYLSFGNRKICNVGLSILRRSFSSGFAPALQKVSVIEENLKTKSRKLKRENAQNEHSEAVDELERAAYPQPLESPALNASRALAMQPFLPLLSEMPRKNPLSQDASLPKQSSERQLALGSQESKEGAPHRNLGLAVLPRIELASKPIEREGKPPATLLKDAVLETPEERIALNEPMSKEGEKPLQQGLQIEAGEKNAISLLSSSLESEKMGGIAHYPEMEISLGQREILGVMINNPSIALDHSLGIEKGEKSGFTVSEPVASLLASSTSSSEPKVAKTIGEFRSRPLTSIERANPAPIKSEAAHLESLPSPLQGKLADQEQAPKPIPIQTKAIENQLKAPSMQASSFREMQNKRILEKEILTNPSLKQSDKPIATPRQGGDIPSALSLPKEPAVLSRTRTSSDSHLLFKDHKHAHEIGNSARRESPSQTPLRMPQDPVSLPRSSLMAASLESNSMKTASPPFALPGQKVIGATFSPAASRLANALGNVEMPSSETPISRIIAVSKTIAEPAIARFAEFPSILSREPKAALEEPPQPLSEQPSLTDPESEQKPEFTVRIYSQPIIIDNYYGVGRL